MRTKDLALAKQEAEAAALSKANFLANMSHEIRTPMNAVLGFTEQLAKSETDTKRVEMFRTIENSGQLLLTIINDILDFSKIESGKMQLERQFCNTTILLEEIASLFTQSCQNKNIQFNLEIDPNLPQCGEYNTPRKTDN
jgi:two-component system, NarL family, sensor histidine kinase EvgS